MEEYWRGLLELICLCSGISKDDTRNLWKQMNASYASQKTYKRSATIIFLEILDNPCFKAKPVFWNIHSLIFKCPTLLF